MISYFNSGEVFPAKCHHLLLIELHDQDESSVYNWEDINNLVAFFLEVSRLLVVENRQKLIDSSCWISLPIFRRRDLFTYNDSRVVFLQTDEFERGKFLFQRLR